MRGIVCNVSFVGLGMLIDLVEGVEIFSSYSCRRWTRIIAKKETPSRNL